MGAANPGSKGQQTPPQGGKGKGQVNPQAPMGKGQGQPMPPQSGSGKGQVNPNPNASQDFMNRISGPQNPLPTQPMPPQGGKGQVQQPGIGVNIMGGVTTPYTIGPNGQPLGGPAYANGKGRVQQPGFGQQPMPGGGMSGMSGQIPSQYGGFGVNQPPPQVQPSMPTQQDLMAQRAYNAMNAQSNSDMNQQQLGQLLGRSSAPQGGMPAQGMMPQQVGRLGGVPQQPMQTQQQMQAELKKQLVGNLSPQQVQQAIPRPAPQQPMQTQQQMQQQLRGLPQNPGQMPRPPMQQQIAQPAPQQAAQRALQQFRPGMAQPKPIAQQGGVYNNPNQSSIMGSNLRGRR